MNNNKFGERFGASLRVGGLTTMCWVGERRRIPFDFQRTSLAGIQQPTPDSATRSCLGRAPALQCRTPSRHHLELQGRRDYTLADRAARTCWLGFPGLLYYLVA
ncbi:hypothetical protein TNCV_411921 [Trichonephila clavipes]|nr:hypothetical protein TNCV_411921 [Trichonephila clavipes]